ADGFGAADDNGLLTVGAAAAATTGSSATLVNPLRHQVHQMRGEHPFSVMLPQRTRFFCGRHRHDFSLEKNVQIGAVWRARDAVDRFLDRMLSRVDFDAHAAGPGVSSGAPAT